MKENKKLIEDKEFKLVDKFLVRFNEVDKQIIVNEWLSFFNRNKPIHHKSMNTALVDILINGMKFELTGNYKDFFEKKFTNSLKELLEESSNKIKKAQFDSTLTILKFLQIDEMKANYIISNLAENGIISNPLFAQKQQLIDTPWMKSAKEQIDEKFAYQKAKGIIQKFDENDIEFSRLLDQQQKSKVELISELSKRERSILKNGEAIKGVSKKNESHLRQVREELDKVKNTVGKKPTKEIIGSPKIVDKPKKGTYGA